MRRILKAAYRVAYGLGTLSLIASVVAGASLAAPSAALAQAETCPDGSVSGGTWYKENPPASAQSGATNYCFKGGQPQSGCSGYYEFHSNFGDFSVGGRCALSHWAYFIPDEETEVPTTPVSTTPVSTTPVSTTPVSTTPASTTTTPEGYSYSVSDPCGNDCDADTLTSTVQNTSGIPIPSSVDINWSVSGPNGFIDSGTHSSGLSTNGSFDIVFNADGEGSYTVTVWLDEDEANAITERCNLACTDETDTPTPPSETETPSAPQSTPEAGVFIPVTGVSVIEGGQSATSYLQNAGFGLLGLGLVLQGISLRVDRKEEDK